MSCPRTSVCLAPLTYSPASRTPRILLGGQHQPTLLRYLDGWPRRKGKATAFLLQFVDEVSALAQYADDRFDLAVVQSPSPENTDEMIHQLTRIARQGLITLR